jgi:uridine kinase
LVFNGVERVVVAAGGEKRLGGVMIGSMDATDRAGVLAGSGLAELATALVDRLRREVSIQSVPLFVGLDGRSGAGKSTIAEVIADVFYQATPNHREVTVIDGDQFYAGGSAEAWDRHSPSEKAAGVIDWRRQRRVLRQLRQRGVAEWYPFDWAAPDWDTDPVPLAGQPNFAEAGSIVLLEGAYSCRPELHDLLDLRVLLEVPREIRRRQLLQREGADYRAAWEARWSAAEDHYFGAVMTPDRFDVVLRSAQHTPRHHLTTQTR